MTNGIAAVLRAFDDGRQRAELYRMWRAGHAAGLIHPATLGKAGHFTGATGALHAHLLAGTRDGRDLGQLVRERPALFEPFEAALLTMGEESGTLEPVLGDLASYFERQYRMMLVVKRRLAYPLFLSLVAIWLAPLPLAFSGQVRAYVATVVVGMLGWVLFGGAVLARRAQAYQRKPMFVRARFARTLALTLGAGLPLGRSVVLAAGASGEPTLTTHVSRLGERRLSTQSLEATLTRAPAMTPELLAAVRVAEATGDVRTSLLRLAELYEDGFR